MADPSGQPFCRQRQCRHPFDGSQISFWNLDKRPLWAAKGPRLAKVKYDDVDGIRAGMKGLNLEVKEKAKWCVCGKRRMPAVGNRHWNKCKVRMGSEPEQTFAKMKLRNGKEL